MFIQLSFNIKINSELKQKILKGNGVILSNLNIINRYKDELTFLRQYLSYILSLQEDVELSEN